MKLGIGSAQFGLDYGVANRTGQVPEAEVQKIIAAAHAYGIGLIDTAHLYGSSEAVLGRALSPGLPFHIVTKTAKFAGRQDPEQLRDTFAQSLRLLGRNQLYGLLFHDSNDVFDLHLREQAFRLRDEGKIIRLGVSVYDPEQAFRAIEIGGLDLIQLPLNILDQRFLRSGVLRALKKAGFEIHVRSVFLQGMLLAEEVHLPAHFALLRDRIAQLRAEVELKGLTLLSAALKFVEQIREVDHYVVGIVSAVQLSELVAAVQSLPPNEYDFSDYHCTDERLTDPRSWPARNAG